MKLGCGLFGLAQELEADFWGTMKKLADSHFTAVEPLYSFRDDPAILPDSPVPSFLKTIMWDEDKALAYQKELEELGLSISSIHVGFLFGKDVKEGCGELVEFSKRSGIRHFMTSLEFDTQQKAEEAAVLLNTAQEALCGTGVSLGYHNHYMEFLPYQDGTLMDYFLELTRPEVKLQVDIGWQMYGGSEVVPFLRKNKDRIVSVHLKDFVKGFEKVEKDDAFAAIGDGALPTEEVLALLPELDLMDNGLMIDQDRAAKDAVLSADLAKGATYLEKRLNRK